VIPSTISGRQRWVAWLVGLFLGMAGAVALLVAGALGIVVVVIAIALIAWRGPRLQSTTGFLIGFGGLWTILFTRVKVTCDAFDALPNASCGAGNIDLWLLGAVAVLAAGLVASVRAFRTTGRS
jgi:hypothetical protein